MNLERGGAARGYRPHRRWSGRPQCAIWNARGIRSRMRRRDRGPVHRQHGRTWQASSGLTLGAPSCPVHRGGRSASHAWRIGPCAAFGGPGELGLADGAQTHAEPRSAAGLRWDARPEILDRWLAALVEVRQSLSRLRAVDDLVTLVHRATSELCQTCEFDRAMLSRVQGSEIGVESARAGAIPSSRPECSSTAGPISPRLGLLLIETEMIRRGVPILAPDVEAKSRTHAGFVTLLGTRAYVAAPVRFRVVYRSIVESGRMADASPPFD